jgi:hypothetical protein
MVIIASASLASHWRDVRMHLVQAQESLNLRRERIEHLDSD